MATTDEQLRLVLEQVRETYGRVAYSHKTHEKQADRCDAWHEGIRWALVVLTALGSTAFIAALSGVWFSEKGASLVTAFLAVVATGGTFAAETFDFGRQAQLHRGAADRLWNLREQYVSLIADIKTGALDLDEARGERERLREAVGAVYAEAPRTSGGAYKKAQDALKNNEELTFTSKELDRLLPPGLREDK